MFICWPFITGQRNGQQMAPTKVPNPRDHPWLLSPVRAPTVPRKHKSYKLLKRPMKFPIGIQLATELLPKIDSTFLLHA
jgi:hypothetical protein